MDGVGQGGSGAAGGETADGSSPGTAADRRRKRDSLFLTGQLTVAGDATSREVRVRNLSEGGLMIETDQLIDVGTAVSLTVRGLGDVIGQIAWCIDGRMGVALDRHIDPRRARKPVGTGVSTPTFAKPLLHAKAPRR